MTVLPDDIVHLSHPGRWFDNLFLLVEEVHEWGVKGVIRLGEGDAPLRVPWGEINAVYRQVKPS